MLKNIFLTVFRAIVGIIVVAPICLYYWFLLIFRKKERAVKNAGTFTKKYIAFIAELTIVPRVNSKEDFWLFCF
jgi:uncharacterized membrane protein YccC